MFADYVAEREAELPSAKRQPSGKPLVFILTIECLWGPTLEEPCRRVVEIKSNSTLLDLHDVIQQTVNFDDDHCFEFFIGRQERDRKIIFGDADEGQFAGDLENIALGRIWPLPKGCFLFYWFDFGDDWKFRIRKARTVNSPVKGVRYPRLTQKVGPDPVQYPGCE